jgi:hypothetical protein
MKNSRLSFYERMIFLTADKVAPIADAYNLNRIRKFLMVIDAGGNNALSGWYGRILRIHIFFLVVRYLERQKPGLPLAPFEHKVLDGGLEEGLRNVF